MIGSMALGGFILVSRYLWKLAVGGAHRNSGGSRFRVWVVRILRKLSCGTCLEIADS